MAKTMFAADAALDSLLASSSPKLDQPAKIKPLSASSQNDLSNRQQLNVEVGSDLFAAINLRKTRSKLAGSKDEDSYCKIVELALKRHLASEVELVSMMKG